MDAVKKKTHPQTHFPTATLPDAPETESPKPPVTYEVFEDVMPFALTLPAKVAPYAFKALLPKSSMVNTGDIYASRIGVDFQRCGSVVQFPFT